MHAESPLHDISPCRQNNERINAKKEKKRACIGTFVARLSVQHSYLYLHLPVLSIHALTRRPPVEPGQEWNAAKVGQKRLFVFCPNFLRREDAFFCFSFDSETFPLILLVFRWCASSAHPDKSVFGLPVSVFFFFPLLSLRFRRNMFNNSSLIFSRQAVPVRAYATLQAVHGTFWHVVHFFLLSVKASRHKNQFVRLRL